MENRSLWQELTTFQGDRRIRLLEAIDASGSISQAARDVGVSYKTAWDMLDALENLSPVPLVETHSGGRHGGGTRLSEHARQLVRSYRSLELAHAARMRDLGEPGLYAGLKWQTSARNHFVGRVVGLVSAGIDVWVDVDIGVLRPLRALVTATSCERLQLAAGVEVHALSKASAWARRQGDAPTPENVFAGRVERVYRAGDQSEAIVAIGAGRSICAKGASADWPMDVGAEVELVCAAQSILLGILHD